MPSSTETIRPNGRERRVRILPPSEATTDRSRPVADDGGAAEPSARPAAQSPDREALYQRIKDTLTGTGTHDEEVQYELGRWLRHLEVVEEDLPGARRPRHVLGRLVRHADIAIAALLSDKPELVFARTLRYRTEMDLLRHRGRVSRLLAKASDGDAAVLVGAGVSLTMVAGIAGYLLVKLLLACWPFLQTVVTPDAGMMTVAQAAFLGGGVSVLARLREFSCSKIRDFAPYFLFWNAMFNPVVAIIFGLFVYSVLASGLIALHDEVTAVLMGPYALWAVGFLSGFSERFTSDIVARAEGLLSTTKKS